MVYEEIMFKYKNKLHFPSQNNRTSTKRTYKQQSTPLQYQEKLNL